MTSKPSRCSKRRPVPGDQQNLEFTRAYLFNPYRQRTPTRWNRVLCWFDRSDRRARWVLHRECSRGDVETNRPQPQGQPDQADLNTAGADVDVASVHLRDRRRPGYGHGREAEALSDESGEIGVGPIH